MHCSARIPPIGRQCMPDTPEEADIRSAISTPKSALIDGEKVDARSIDDKIAGVEFLEAQEAKKNPGIGVQLFRTKPSGAR